MCVWLRSGLIFIISFFAFNSGLVILKLLSFEDGSCPKVSSISGKISFLSSVPTIARAFLLS